jgi:hypothetical protein
MKDAELLLETEISAQNVGKSIPVADILVVK